MWAEVGRYLLAFGPWGLAVILGCFVLAILAITWFIYLINKYDTQEVEITIRPSGISVRWVKPSKR